MLDTNIVNEYFTKVDDRIAVNHLEWSPSNTTKSPLIGRPGQI